MADSSKKKKALSESGVMPSDILRIVSPKELLKLIPRLLKKDEVHYENLNEDTVVPIFQDVSTRSYHDFRKQAINAGRDYEYVMVPQAYAQDDPGFQESLVEYTVDLFNSAKESGGHMELSVLMANTESYEAVIATCQALQENNIPFHIKEYGGSIADLPDFALLGDTVFKVENYEGLPIITQSDSSTEQDRFKDILKSSDFSEVDASDLFTV